MRPNQGSFNILKLLAVALLLVGLIAALFTVWAWRVRTDSAKVPVANDNAYCSNGSCYRTNGMYIGPDPLSPSSDEKDAKVPEYIPPKNK